MFPFAGVSSMSIWYEKLNNRCLELGISLSKAAELMGIPYNTVSKWRNRNPSPDHIERVRRFLQQNSFSGQTLMERNILKENESIPWVEQKEVSMVVDKERSKSSKTESSEGITPLSKKETGELIIQHEIIRDPVHHDIWITALERAIIDSPDFQRLHNLTQLGPTQLVYPGATHNRFLHSLGTLHCAEELVAIINRNHKVYDQPWLIYIEDYPHFLIRLCALLHDLAHMPFGHTLEDEGKLVDDEWNDIERVKLFLEDDGKSVITTIKNFLLEKGVNPENVDLIIKDIRRYILQMKQPMGQDYPYICDIVGNTLCADLLDYLERDMYFCGLKEKSGDRVIKYLAVARLNLKPNTDKKEKEEEFEISTEINKGKGRVVLLAYRFEREHGPEGIPKPVIKSEILSEAIDLLRRRFTLAEKVYFHRTKIAASAMLISAVSSSTTPITELYSLGDMQFLLKLNEDKTKNNERCRHLISAYQDRRLYKSVFNIDYIPKTEEPQSQKLWNDIYPKYRDPNYRKQREEEIEYLAKLPPGSIAIYCPDQKMNLKEFEMLVHNHPKGDVKYLTNILDTNRKQEMEVINNRFAQLWKLQIFVAPEVLDVTQVSTTEVQNLNAICESIVAFPNSILELQRTGKQLQLQIADRVIDEWEKEHGEDVPHRVSQALVKSLPRTSAREMIESYRNSLNTLMETQDKDK